jgi:hypothetical protein
MTFELLLALRRMITQSRETERTQRDEVRVVGPTAPADFITRGAAATVGALKGSELGATA